MTHTTIARRIKQRWADNNFEKKRNKNLSVMFKRNNILHF